MIKKVLSLAGSRLPLRRVNDEALKILWPTSLTDKELAWRLGHHRSVLRRRAERLGLPPRSKARTLAFDALGIEVPRRVSHIDGGNVIDAAGMD